MIKDARALDPAELDADIVTRRETAFDLLVNGATLSQIARTLGVSRSLVNSDIKAVTDELNDQAIARSRQLREEITARERAIAFNLMPQVRAGSVKAAQAVNRSDALIATIWGLRSIRVDIDTTPPPRDPAIADALEGYLAGILHR